jgi:hypothetical protein
LLVQPSFVLIHSKPDCATSPSLIPDSPGAGVSRTNQLIVGAALNRVERPIGVPSGHTMVRPHADQSLSALLIIAALS